MAENSPPKPRSVAHKQRRNQDSRPHDARFPVKLSPPIRRSHHESVCYRGTFNAFESLPVSRQLCFAGFVSRSATLHGILAASLGLLVPGIPQRDRRVLLALASMPIVLSALSDTREQ